MKSKIILYISIVLIFTTMLVSCSKIKTITHEIIDEIDREYKIDNKTYSSKYKGERIRYIIIHYTTLDDETSFRVLTEHAVSIHYIITTNADDPIYQLVDENDRAWHAGPSNFDGRKAINDSSIGIEIVNYGRLDEESEEFLALDKEQKIFMPPEMYLDYDQKQMDKLVFLLKDIIERYNIHPSNVIGHSDVAPTRKQDPGAKFPWKWLYEEHGIGLWYDMEDYTYFMENEEEYTNTSIIDIKKEFYKYGYTGMPINDKWDEISRSTLYAFQLHFRPELLDGNIDLETYAIIKALNKKIETIEANKYYIKIDKRNEHYFRTNNTITNNFATNSFMTNSTTTNN